MTVAMTRVWPITHSRRIWRVRRATRVAVDLSRKGPERIGAPCGVCGGSRCRLRDFGAIRREKRRSEK